MNLTDAPRKLSSCNCFNGLVALQIFWMPVVGAMGIFSQYSFRQPVTLLVTPKRLSMFDCFSRNFTSGEVEVFRPIMGIILY